MRRNDATIQDSCCLCQNVRMAGGKKAPPGTLSHEMAAILRGKMGHDKITAQAVADAVGMSRAQVSGVLNGKKHVDVEQLDRICFSLGLTLEKVLREADKAASDRHAEPSWTTQRLSPVGERL